MKSAEDARTQAAEARAQRGFWALLPYLRPHRQLIVQLVLGMTVASLLGLVFPFLTQALGTGQDDSTPAFNKLDDALNKGIEESRGQLRSDIVSAHRVLPVPIKTSTHRIPPCTSNTATR